MDETIFQVSYGKVDLKVIRKMDEANDKSCYNCVVSHPSSVKMRGCIAANGDGNLHFCRVMKNIQDYIHFIIYSHQCSDCLVKNDIYFNKITLGHMLLS